MPVVPQPTPSLATPPPRAFTQGLGLVFQVVGSLVFMILMFVCCASGLLSKDFATHTPLNHIGWHRASDPATQPFYSAQMAVTISLFIGVLLGMALAGVGLGMQAEYRAAAAGAVVVTFLGSVFWIVQTLFAATAAHSLLFTLIGGGLAALFIMLLILSISAMLEMRRTPPPRGHDVLPADYKIPYSHYHEDPPEVRLERELQQRRERLLVQQKEVEMLEDRLRKRLDEKQQDEGRDR